MNAEETADAERQLKAKAREVGAHFLVPRPIDEVFAKFDTGALPVRGEYRLIMDAFRGSMSSAVSTVALPYALTSAGVHRSHFQRIHIASRIRAQAYDWDDAKAREVADADMSKWLSSDEGHSQLITDILDSLSNSFRNGIESAAHELLRQGLVLVWSAFEVLSRDIFETVMNQEPKKIQGLMANPITRRRFEAERLSMDVLLRYSFDLSTKLGTVLVSQNDFSDLPFIKSLYSVLYPGNVELTESLSHKELWLLYQRRNLIVHRNAVVDQLYLDNTGEAAAIGQRLVFTSKQFDVAFDVVASAGTALVQSLPKLCESA